MNRDVIYVFGNDAHRGTLRPAIVIKWHKDGSADLVVFAEPNEAQNEGEHGTGTSTPCFVKRRVPRDNGTSVGDTVAYKPVSFHEEAP